MIIPLLWLTLSNVCVCAMSLFRKQYEKVNGTKLVSVLLFLCVSSAFICVGAFAVLGARITYNGLSFLLAFGLSCVSILGAVTSLVGLQYGNMSILMIFARMGGIVLSCLYGLLFDPMKNTLSVWKIVGFVFVAIILALSFVYEKKEVDEIETKSRKKQSIFAFLCILIFFNGLALPMMSIQTRFNPEYKALDFTVLYIFFQFLISLLAFVCMYVLTKNKREINRELKCCVKGKGIWCVLANMGNLHKRSTKIF